MPQKESQSHIRQYAAQIIVSVIGAVISGVIVAIIIQDARFSPARNPTPTSLAQVATDTPIGNPTPNGVQPLQPSEFHLTPVAQTQASSDFTATYEFLSNIYVTRTAQRFAATETSAYSTLIALSLTPINVSTYTQLPNASMLTSTPSAIISQDTTYPDGFNLLSLGWWESVRGTLSIHWLLNLIIYFPLILWTCFWGFALAVSSRTEEQFRYWQLAYTFVNVPLLLFGALLYEGVPLIILLGGNALAMYLGLKVSLPKEQLDSTADHTQTLQ